MAHAQGASTVTGPALAVLELGDVPAGLVALDAIAKEAPVTVIGAGTIHHGHWLIVFAGEVEPVEMSYARACERAGAAIVDGVLLPHAEPRLLPALRGGARRFPAPGDALGMVQAGFSPTLVGAVDAGLKGAAVELVELRLAEGLGGRAIAALWGAQYDVEEALDHARSGFARGRPEGCSAALIPNADPEIARVLGTGTRFYKELYG